MLKSHIFSHVFFNKTDNLSQKINKNIFWSLVFQGLNILIGFIMIPMALGYVNELQYGIWLTILSFLSWLNFFDIGLGNGLRNKFAEAVAKNEYDLAREYVSTTYFSLSIIVVLLISIFLLIFDYLNWTVIFNAPKYLATELKYLMLIVVIIFSIRFVLILINSIITANQSPSLSAGINFSSNSISLLFIFTLTYISKGSLIFLGIAISIAPVIVLSVASFILFSKSYKYYKPSLKYVRISLLKDLLNLGGKFFVIQIAAIIIFTSSNFLISHLYGPENVTPYNIALKYFSIVSMAFSIILNPFWSGFTNAYFKGEFEWIKRKIKVLTYIFIIFCITAITLFLISEYVYLKWIGNNIIIDTNISLLVSMIIILQMWNNIFSVFLNGTGKIKILLFYSITIMITNIPISIFFAVNLNMGISGIILTNILFLFISGVWSPFQYYKLINKEANGIWGK